MKKAITIFTVTKRKTVFAKVYCQDLSENSATSAAETLALAAGEIIHGFKARQASSEQNFLAFFG
ncbi:MAG TPA: hypothetical protein VGY98_08520 [Verrucomicrobiae bacterium]|nr:hypothetical protein [Verrucomicrobiae bacterium]